VPTGRRENFITSPASNTILAVLGLLVPALAWLVKKAIVVDALLLIETLIVIVLAWYHFWLRSAYHQLRRANSRRMSDPRYFDAIRRELEADLVNEFEEIAEGNVHVYAGDVPRVSSLLYKVLITGDYDPKRVLATDLTTDPRILGQRRDYLAVNRRLVEAGGSIQRVFIYRNADLLRRTFAADLLALVAEHQALGVQCGLAVREWLRPDQSVDFVVVARAAVLMEDEQGDEAYEIGRSTVSFLSVEKWIRKFDEIWKPADGIAAAVRLSNYVAAAGPMLNQSAWRPSAVRAGLEFRAPQP
jgi:hypothetical protein